MQPFCNLKCFISERPFKTGCDFTDSNIFEVLVNKYGDMVYRIALSHTCNKTESEDIFQEVFLKLVKNYNKLTDDKHVKYWLIRVTVNLCKSYNSSWSKRKTELLNNEIVDFKSTIPDDLKFIIEELPQKYKTVIYLFYYEKYSIQEIADILNIKKGTVKSQLSRARKILKNNLEEGQYE